MKKTLIFVLVFIFLAGTTGVLLIRNMAPKEPQVPAVKNPVMTLPAPVRSKSVAAPEPAVVSGYVIGILSLSKSINGHQISMKIINDSGDRLQLDPDNQFKLVGTTDQTVRLPISAKTTAGFKGTLAAGAEISGMVYFDTIPEQQSELRFFPDPASPTYIIVPLIPLPDDQR